MSRAVAKFEVTRWVTRLRRFSFALAMASCMVASLHQPVLDEPLRETAEGHATGAAGGRYCVVIHGLTMIPGAIQPILWVAGRAIVKSPQDTRILRASVS